MRLKGGHETSDPRLDRIPQFDERSRRFQIAPLLAQEGLVAPRSYTWSNQYWLDQGNEGACTGFSTAHELGARPVALPVNNDLARAIYYRARQIDEWPGEDYEGSSVLAAVKAAKEVGYYGEYRWVGAGSQTAIEDLILAVGYKGPVILGINWYEGMMDPDSNGYISPTGDIVGGHAILCRAVSVRRRCFGLHNSWGNSSMWWVTFTDMERLLHEQGEGCVIINRLKPTS